MLGFIVELYSYYHNKTTYTGHSYQMYFPVVGS